MSCTTICRSELLLAIEHPAVTSIASRSSLLQSFNISATCCRRTGREEYMNTINSVATLDLPFLSKQELEILAQQLQNISDTSSELGARGTLSRLTNCYYSALRHRSARLGRGNPGRTNLGRGRISVGKRGRSRQRHEGRQSSSCRHESNRSGLARQTSGRQSRGARHPHPQADQLPSGAGELEFSPQGNAGNYKETVSNNILNFDII